MAESFDAKLQLFRLLKEKTVRSCREDSFFFTDYIFGFKSVHMHQTWHTFMNNSNHGIMLANRDSGKSQHMMGRVLWEIGKNPNIRIKIATETDELAGKTMTAISNTILRNERFKEVFPHTIPTDTGQWSKFSITVQRDAVHLRDPTVEGAGMMTAVTGARADLVMFDDICFDKETEVLTPDGWKLFKDLLPTDNVATLDKNQCFEWQKPSRYITKYYEGSLYAYESKGINFAVTPRHNMYVSLNKGVDFKSVPVEDIYGKSTIRFKKDCSWKGTNQPVIIPSYKNQPSVIIATPIFAAILGFFIAEGFVVYNRRNKAVGIGFSQNDGPILQEFLGVLSKIPYKYHIYDSHNYNINKRVQICSTQLGLFMEQFGRGSKNKYLPDWVLAWDKELLNIFFNWYQEGDGTDSCVYTSSKKLVGNLFEVALKTGITLRERIRKHQPKRYNLKDGGEFNHTTTSTSYELILSKKKNLQPTSEMSIRKKYWKTIDYKDMVYCVTVPNGTIYVRRNKSSFWCQNCGMRNTLYFPRLREQVKESFYSNWMNFLDGPEARWYLIGTPWHVEDLIGELRSNDNIPKAKEWWVGDNFESPWPERFSSDYFKGRLLLLKSKHYNRAYRGLAVSDQDSWINVGAVESCKDFTLKAYDVIQNKEFPKFTGVDLSHREGPKACPTVIFTMARTPNGKRIPCDIRILHDSNSLEIARAIIHVYEELKPAMITVENNNAQQYLVDTIKSLGPVGIPVQGYHTGHQKADVNVGVPSLLAEIETGQWVIPLGAGGNHDETCRCPFCIWINEIKSYPYGSTDTVMASWLGVEGLRKIMEKRKPGGQFTIWQF